MPPSCASKHHKALRVQILDIPLSDKFVSKIAHLQDPLLQCVTLQPLQPPGPAVALSTPSPSNFLPFVLHPHHPQSRPSYTQSQLLKYPCTR
ncbi:hypothetical protein CC77DRAFT_1017761 [Alternaria alternata]|uniref:Uncharacterized protein n=1 Tax=Alternaria alternata TaxID=5599 RepID=A0A177DXG3_ALTAL|nr:hypothetical protein CC77DRAFT_1017761 [Alternaria alternata]OAG24168.1 hypothetical protein CC77DRAFT_1017761 [Alternaria alternata]